MPVYESAKTYGLFGGNSNRKLIAEVESSGAEVLLFPHTRISAAEFSAEDAETIETVLNFDWIIVPDVFAAEYFLLALENAGIDFYELDAVRICAFGESVSDRLRYSQVHADVITKTVEAADAVTSIKDYEPDFASLKTLVLHSEAVETQLSTFLSKEEINFTELKVYESDFESNALLTKLKSLLKGGAVDEFLFCSPTEIAEFAVLFVSETPSGLLFDALASAPDYSTFQSLREFSLKQIRMR